MEDFPLHQRRVGVNFDDQGLAQACLWAPQAQQAWLVPTTGNRLPLTQGELGYWHLTTDALRPGDRYRFALDSADPLPDPASLSQPEGVHGSSEALDLRGLTPQKKWQNPPLADYLLYELHVGTFSPEGTFAGVAARLDHLRALGVNAIEIMPVAQFPGTRNWGYDGVFPFAVQHSYGGAEGLRQLVEACHRAGIAVVLDVVYNHLGPEGNYLGAFGPYFTDKYRTPWGAALNFDDAWCDGVRHFFIENALMWFRDFGVDALRLDAVHAIKDFSPSHLLRDLRLQVDALMADTGRTHYLIVESDLNNVRFLKPLAEGGFGMDAQWIDEFHHALRVATGEPPTGYYSDFAGVAHLAKAYRDAYVFDGQYSAHRQRLFGSKATGRPGEQFVVFSQNHDQVGNRMRGERTSQLVGPDVQRLLAGATLVAPYLPMLFMGEEWGETNPFLYFVSHGDAALIEAVRKGRKAEFAAFHAEGEAPDPQVESTFEASKLSWNWRTQPAQARTFAYYQRLLQLRRELPALRQPDRTHTEVTQHGDLLVLTRGADKASRVVVLLNFGEQTATVLPGKSLTWHCALNAADRRWGGPDEEPLPPVAAGETVAMPAHGFRIYLTHA